MALALILMPALAHAHAHAQIIIAHRGASGERPEHTLAAYERAIDSGADFIEPDLVPTKDGVLVARHENEISGTTDVADHPGFAARKATRVIDGESVTGWFTEDFTLAELRTLRARERLPELRPANTRFDGLYPVPTLAEILALVKAKEAESGRQIGIYPELKHPTYFAAQGLDTAALLLAALHQAGYRDAAAPVFIQCFEVGTLKRLRRETALRLIQLVSREGGPADRPGESYAAMLTPAGLAAIHGYAAGIGAEAALVVRADGQPTGLAAEARKAGLLVHVWTLRRENRFLPPLLRTGDDPAASGNFAGAYAALVGAGIDGVFTDNPAQAVAARTELAGTGQGGASSRP